MTPLTLDHIEWLIAIREHAEYLCVSRHVCSECPFAAKAKGDMCIVRKAAWKYGGYTKELQQKAYQKVATDILAAHIFK